MRNKKTASTVISVLTAILITFIMTFSAFAVEEPVVSDPEVYVPEETQAEVFVPEETLGYVETEPEIEIQTEAPQQEQEEEPQEVQTEAPANSSGNTNELPKVDPTDIIAPTSIDPPDIEVSDTSLLGGVIAWLCVAVGIAVIAGVLVSQRTRQNPGNRR